LIEQKEEKSTLKDIFLIVFSVMLAAVGQFLLKMGMLKVGKMDDLARAPSTLLGAFTNPLVIAGLSVFAVSALSWLLVLSRVNLSIAYPMVSLGYVAVVILSHFILKEQIKPITIVGCLVIGLGVFLIARGMQQVQ
jgi:drug/metabolite transporter (DMT)-like permease